MELAHSGAKERASCEAKLTVELLSYLQRLQRSLAMSSQGS